MMMRRQLLHVKIVCKSVKHQHVYMDVWLFGLNYRNAATLYLTVLGIIIQSLKLIGQFWYTLINKPKKPKIIGHTDFLVMIIELFRFLSKLIFLRISIPKFMMIRQLFHVKNVCKNVKIQHVLNWTYGLLGQNFRVATLSTFYLTVLKIIIPSLKSKELFWHT